MIFHFLRSTVFKVKTAHIIYRVLKLLRFDMLRRISRGGVTYEVDLREGIDLSLFVLGNFQRHVVESSYFEIRDDAVVFDVGANIGCVSLYIANKYRKAMVYAFEPTHYAFKKLITNIALNEKKVGGRVRPIQAFVTCPDSSSDLGVAYSSWRIDDLSGTRHPMHMGLPGDTTDTTLTIDDFVRREKIRRVDYIKIDTDGHELDVLNGAIETLVGCKPIVVFELSTYMLREKGQLFSDYISVLDRLGYSLIDGVTGVEVTASNIGRIVPKAGSTDIVASPNLMA